MRWFRLNRRLCAAVAIFALAVQFAVSFAHVHVGGHERPGAEVARVRANPAAQRAPDGHPAGQADVFCDICATLSLLASAQTPEAAALPVRIAFAATGFDRSSEHAPPALYRPFVRSRAPPVA